MVITSSKNSSQHLTKMEIFFLVKSFWQKEILLREKSHRE